MTCGEYTEMGCTMHPISSQKTELLGELGEDVPAKLVVLHLGKA